MDNILNNISIKYIHKCVLKTYCNKQLFSVDTELHHYFAEDTLKLTGNMRKTKIWKLESRICLRAGCRQKNLQMKFVKSFGSTWKVQIDTQAGCAMLSNCIGPFEYKSRVSWLKITVIFIEFNLWFSWV